MATVNYTQFLPEVLPSVPGCADLLALNAIRNAVIEFCRGTNYWQERQDPVTVTKTDFPYDLEAPTGAQVAQVLTCMVNGLPTTPLTQDELDARVQNWATRESTVIQNYFCPSPNQIVLYPLPQDSVEMILRVAYVPLRNSSSVDATVYQNYLEKIAAGALKRLMAIPNQSFTNPQGADYYGKIFADAIVEGAVEVNKSFSRATPMVQMRPAA